MFAKQKIILIALLFIYQINNIFSDELILISKYSKPRFGGFWGFRINEYKDITLRFFLSDNIDKENKFEILQMIDHHYEDIGYGTYIIKDGIIDSFKVIKCKHKVAGILTNQRIELYFTDQDLYEYYYLLFEKSKIKYI